MPNRPEETKRKEVRKEYFPPKFVHTETMEARAVSCAMENDANCQGGPIQS